MTSRLIRAMLAVVGAGLVAGGALVAAPPRGHEALDPGRAGTLRLEDREGRPLRDVPVGGERSQWVSLAELPPWVPAALVVAEDRRFFHHAGIDPLALVRAAAANREAGRVVSGGSTITMQLARLLAGPSPRTPAAKCAEALDAIRLEARLSKPRILEEYLNRVHFGRGAVGIEAAAVAWFGRSARTLSPAEAAWLAVLPRAPAYYGRVENRNRLEARRQGIVDALAARGYLDSMEAAAALARPPEPIDPRSAPFHAPHWTTWLLDEAAPAARNGPGRLRTTLDLALQEDLQARLRIRCERLAERGATQAAIVVQRTDTGEVLALVGSADFDGADAGQVNGALAFRQPGSTLKPFTYALAFEAGDTPASIVLDEPAAFAASGGPFVPRNYGGAHFGPVTLRTALASSLNMPAVRLLERIGVDRLQARLARLGLSGPGAADAGLGLTLGTAEVRLVDLVNAYAALGRGGRFRPRVLVLENRDGRGRPRPLPSPGAPRRVFDPLAAWWITDILSDDDARRLTFGAGGVLDMPWPVAVKTGTSSDWRDNWAIGTTSEWTVGVWVGDFGGRPMQRVSGVFGAAPLLREVFGVLARHGPISAPPAPPGLRAVDFCPVSGRPAATGCPPGPVEYLPLARTHGAACPKHANGVVAEAANTPITIEQPTDGDVYFLDPALPPRSAVVRFAARGTAGESLDWLLDGHPLGRTPGVGHLDWALQPGSHRLVVRGAGATASCQFTVVGLAPGSTASTGAVVPPRSKSSGNTGR